MRACITQATGTLRHTSALGLQPILTTGTEMGNGAMRLEAEINGIPFRATFARKSKEYPAIMENGGVKMPFEKQKEYVERLFIPRLTI